MLLCLSEMVFQAPWFKVARQLLRSMFFLRGLVYLFMGLCFMGVLLSVMLIIGTCKQYSVNEVQNELKFVACRTNRDNFDNFVGRFDGKSIASELVLRHPVEQHSLDDIWPLPNSFCFASTLIRFLVNRAELEAVTSRVQSEVLSSRLRQMTGNLSWSSFQGIFRFLGGRNITWSFYGKDGFPVFPANDRSRSVENSLTANSGFLHSLATLPVEVKLSILDWGFKNMFYPCLAFLTAKTVCSDSVLSVYDLHSRSPQFYPWNVSEVQLARGEVASVCSVFFPACLGFSFAQFVLRSDISSIGRWREDLSLLKSPDEALYVEELTAWISTSSGNTCSSKFICCIHKMENSDWSAVERGEVGRPNNAVRLCRYCAVDSQPAETITELDILGNYDRKIVFPSCLQLSISPNHEADTVVAPHEAKPRPNTASETEHTSLLQGALVPCVDSSAGKTEEINNVDYITGRVIFFSQSMRPPSEIKAMDTKKVDESVPGNWKSHATVQPVSVLYESELLFPKVLGGNYCSQWISLRNLSQEHVVMELILNPGDDAYDCKMPEALLQPSSSFNIVVGNKSNAPIRCDFLIPKDALTEALVHPYNSTTLRPILFQSSNRHEWRSPALISNNLTGLEWLSLRGFGGLISLVLLEGNDSVQSMEFRSPSDALQSMAGKTPSCCQSSTEEIYAKNVGDLPVEVVWIEVSEVESGSAGFTICNCKGFSLQPGESATLHILYQSNFSAATVHRDLQLALASGLIVVPPLRASVPSCLLDFCNGMLVILLAASSLAILLFHVASVDSGQRKNNSLSSAISESINQEEALVLESDSLAPGQGAGNPYARHQNETISEEPETSSISATSGLSSGPLSAESNDAADPSEESQNLRIRVGKEKSRRGRKKKKGSGAGTPLLPYEISSSQSSNSTPSSPLSPAVLTSATPKWSLPMWPPPAIAPPFNQTSKTTDDSNYKLITCAQENPSLPTTSHTPFQPVSNSPVDPNLRAASGTKHDQEEMKMNGLQIQPEMHIYDIWGDHLHLFGHHQSTYLSKVVSGMSSSSPAKEREDHWESFFVRDPPTLITNLIYSETRNWEFGGK